MKRESGSEVKMPDAEEEAERILRADGPARLWERIADIQRRTLLAISCYVAGLDAPEGAGIDTEAIYYMALSDVALAIKTAAASLGEPGK